ncbi:XkdX family protein [Liquorilactobacillus sp.]
MEDYVKEYYLLGLYTDSDLDIFASAGMITSDEENGIKATKTVKAAGSAS